MRIHLLSVSILFGFLPFFANAQNYTPLLDSFNEWHFTTCYNSCLVDEYYTDGDTVVNGKSYKILDGYHYISRSFLLREDVSSRKVYLIFLDGSFEKFEYLLYDFSIQVGDTFDMRNPISPFPSNPGAFICDSIIFRPLVNGNSYKHFYFHPIDSLNSGTNSAVWVEGVGSLSLINAPGGEPNLNGTGELTCFFKAGVSFYESEHSTTKCVANYVPNGVSELGVASIQVFQNTENQELILQTKQFPYQYRILDINGRSLIGVQTITTEKYTLDLSFLAHGLFLLELTDQLGIITVEKILR